MRDPFNRAHQMHQSNMAVPSMGQPPAAPAAPVAPTMQSTVTPAPKVDFAQLAKKAGIGHLKLDKNPAIARTQLITHLKNKYGQDYMSHPEASKLLDAFNGADPSSTTPNLTTGQAKTLGSLIGGPGQ